MRRARAVLVGCALVMGTTGVAAQPPDNPGAHRAALGGLEGEALSWALIRLGLQVDGAPEGKRLRRIHVANLPVFTGADGWGLQWLNALHLTTRVEAVAREVLLVPGELWDAAVVEETERKLRNPVYSTLVVVVPVRAPEPGTFDLLVVTRDIWSLRLNLDWELQQRHLTAFTIGVTENNVLGWRKRAGVLYVMDQGSYAIGPMYRDPNLLGERLVLEADAAILFGRERDEREGSRSRIRFGRPWWSLSHPWGWESNVAHAHAVERVFRGTDLLAYDIPETPEVEALPHEFRTRALTADAALLYQVGDRFKYRLGLGYRFELVRNRVLDEFPGDAFARDWFEAEVLPRSEVVSSIFTRIGLLDPRFQIYRDVETYDLAEDVQIGPDLSAEISAAMEPLGSDESFLGFAAIIGWTFDWSGEGYARVRAVFESRLRESDFLDNLVQGTAVVATPLIGGRARVVARGDLATRFDETRNRFFTAGGDFGLRGYDIGAFMGTSRLVANLELRTLPVELGSVNLGAVVFYEVGHAANGLSDLDLHQDVGVGLRLLIPQLDRDVFRIDWAVPLDGDGRGFPGRITAGVGQAFSW